MSAVIRRGVRCEETTKNGKLLSKLAVLATVDNNDTVSKGFIWFHSKNETIKREVKLSFRTETMLISLSNWNLLREMFLH